MEEPKGKNVDDKSKNVKKPLGWQLTKFGKDKPAIPGPGRPRLSDAVREAREILKSAAPEMVAKIIQLTKSSDDDISIKAIKVGLDKILPNLEELETHDDRLLPDVSEAQLESKLALIRANRNGRSSGTGSASGNGVAS